MALVAVEAESCADKVKYVCVVKDETQIDYNKQKVVFSLAYDCDVRELCCETARRMKYQEETYLLVWEKADNVTVVEVVLDWNSSQSLMDLGLNEKRNTFLVREKDGKQPVTIHEDSNKVPDTTTSGATVSTVSNNNNSQYGPSYHSNSALYSKSETGYVGLVNQAMTCYLNSLLQTLYMTPEFRNALYRVNFGGNQEDEERNIPRQLQRLFIQLQTSNKRSIETTDITRSFGWDSSESWQQHDVQELCRVMFDALEQKFALTQHKDLINRLYQGKMKDYVKCLKCGYENAKEDSYLDIPLVIKRFGSDQVFESVEAALTDFVTPETLTESNQYDCSKCGEKCDAHKGLRFTSFPYLLTMQLKRFDFDYVTLSRIKLNDRMTFPLELNLNGYISDKDNDPPVLLGTRRSQSETLKEDLDGCTDDIDSSLADNAVSAVAADLSPSVAAVAAAAADLRLTSSSSSYGMSNKSSGLIQCNDGPEGPYIYELFSIMVHSGSAIGGHYYAYIKSFSDGQWYCFNDQTVSRITEDDLKKTYGGSDRSRSSYYSYSSVYSASANAYMLMYRQKCPEQNTAFLETSCFPKHIHKLREMMKEQEELEQRQKELDRSVCKIKLFCRHPTDQKMMELRLEVHKDKTLEEATGIAYEMFQLQKVVPIERCRLVKYDEFYESLEHSYEGEEEYPISKVLGGVRHIYNFDLLLEIRGEGQKFKHYKSGGVTIKAFLVDLENETMSRAATVRSHLSDTIADLTCDIAEAFNVSSKKMRLCVEQYYRDVKVLDVPDRALKKEGFYKTAKVFAEAKGEDVDFFESRLFKFLDSAANSVILSVTIPSSELQQNGDVQSDKSLENRSGGSDATGGSDTKDDDQPPPLMPKPKTITLKVDRRITLSDLKQKLEQHVGQPASQFRIFRVYSNNQEFEATRLEDTLTAFSDDTKLVVKYGRALAPGEFRAKVYELLVNNPEPSKFLFDWIISKKMTVGKCKEEMLPELEKHGIKTSFDRLRIRKKTWRNPGTILLNDQVFDTDISIYSNWEMFVEVLNGPEPLQGPSHMSLFARRWCPSTYTLQPFQEVVLEQSSPLELKEKISRASDIPVERVEFAKGRGSFPCDVSLLEIQEELDWNPTVTVLNVWPLYIYDDGAVIFYRDSEEKPMTLSEERRREIQKEESARYAKSNNNRYQYYRKEKALKIYMDTTPQSTSPRDSPPPESSSQH